MTTLLIIIYFLLGIHSSYFFIRRFTLQYDFELGIEIIPLLVCFLFPIIGYILTIMCLDYSTEQILINIKQYQIISKNGNK